MKHSQKLLYFAWMAAALMAGSLSAAPLGTAFTYQGRLEQNGQLAPNEAREATRALNGVPSLVKTQLEAIKLFEQGSEKARAEAAKILGIEPPKDQRALEGGKKTS